MTKYMRAVVDASDDGGDMTFIASTAGIKADGLSIDQSRWDLSNYNQNPVFLFAHDYSSLPIGRTEAWVEDGVLRAKVTKWAQTPFANDVRQAYDDGILNAVSVGWEDVDDDGRPIKRGQTAARHVLLDVSAVPVPGDPDALVERQRSAFAQIGQELLRMARTDDEGDGGPAEVVDPEVFGAETVDDAEDVTPETLELTDEDTTDAERGQDAWADIAAGMVAVFDRESDDSDDERRTAYRALLPKYRRHGVEAPEFLTTAELAATGEPEWRAVFLAGELDVLGVVEGQRAGAVLNARNMKRITSARDLLTEVIDSATKPDKEQERAVTSEPPSDEPQHDEPDDPLALLRSMRDMLTEAHDG